MKNGLERCKQPECPAAGLCLLENSINGQLTYGIEPYWSREEISKYLHRIQQLLNEAGCAQEDKVRNELATAMDVITKLYPPEAGSQMPTINKVSPE